jgi:hypothetical protein
MFLGYIMLQLFCITACDTCNAISPEKYYLHFYISTFSSMYVSIIIIIIIISAASCYLELWVRIPPDACKFDSVSVVCCQVEVSAWCCSLFQRSFTDNDVSNGCDW